LKKLGKKTPVRRICIIAGAILAAFLVPLAARAWLVPPRLVAAPVVAVWTAPKPISHNTSYNVLTDNGMRRYSTIAARGSNVYAMWSKRQGTEGYQFDPYSNNSSNEGQDWGTTDTELQDSDNTETYAPLDLTIADNTPHYVWAEKSESNYIIFYKYGLSSPQIVEMTTDEATQPAIEVSSGYVHVVWSQGHLDNDIMYESKPVGSGSWLGSPVNISQSTDPPALHPDIAADNSGNLHVVWDQGIASGTILYKKRTGGSWSSAGTVSGDVAHSRRPAIAVHGDNVYVVWCEYVGKNEQYVRFSKKSIADETSWPGTTKRISDDEVGISQTLSTYILPAIAVDGNGKIHVAWHGGLDSSKPEEIFYSSSTNEGNTWSDKSNLSNSGNDDSTAPSLAVTDNYIHIIWAEQYYEEEGRYIYDVYYSRTGTWGGSGGVYLPIILKSY